MNRERWERVQDLFARALELPASERAVFLAAECDDDALRDEVASLLAAADVRGPLDTLANRFTPVRDLLTERVPSQVGPYVISERIGAGGMAVVYRAHDPRLRRDVALKFLPATLLDHSPAADRLIAEARAASALDHPNICTIFDIASGDDGRLFIAMAYYAGGTLEDRLRNGPLPLLEAVDIARQVAAALQCAHDAGIVHRDVKPANIAFGERGEVKVLDFGVALLTDDADGDSTAGTPSYMAPEQVRGDPADARTDVWSLGVVLFEMVTGQRPFTGPDRAAVQHEIQFVDPPAVTSLRGETPQRLAAVIDRALSKDRTLRFASAAEFSDALAAARAALLPTRRVRRRAWAVAAVAVLLLSVAAIARIAPESPLRVYESTNPLLDEQYTRARERFITGTPQGNEAAIVILRNILERDSTHVPARALLATAYAVATRPDFSRPAEREWLDSAFVHANAAIALDSMHPDGHAALGTVLRWYDRLDEAKAHLERALDLQQRHGLAALELGFIFHLERRYADAAILLEHGLAFEPDVAGARQYAAALYRVFDLLPEARRHVDNGRAIAPDDASLIWESVLIAVLEGDTALARREFEAYLQLTSEAERPRMQAWYYIVRNQPDSARVHIDRVDLTNAASYDLREFGVTLIRVGQRNRGATLLRRALAKIEEQAGVPEWGRTNPGFERAYILAALGEREAAIAALREWYENGGLRTWMQGNTEWPWRSIDDDPRFIEIVRLSEERFREERARVIAGLARLRE